MKSQKIVVGVLGLPINKHGQFLLTQRNDPTNTQTHLKWEIAGGGLEFGESPEETLLRELNEELGVVCKTLYDLPIAVANTWVREQHGAHVVLLVYLVDIGDQAITLCHENVDYGWFSADEIKKLDCLPKIDTIITQAEELIQTHQLADLL